jgi:hypothetical protein
MVANERADSPVQSTWTRPQLIPEKSSPGKVCEGEEKQQDKREKFPKKTLQHTKEENSYGTLVVSGIC